MVTLSKIYTRTGDGGRTRLVGGQQVPKDALRIEAYGAVDELNAVMGLARAETARSGDISEAARERLLGWLHETQQRLFDAGSDLATYLEDRFEGQPVIEARHVAELEALIDELNADLGVLKSFVLPGSGELNARFQVARTICRRAERRAVALAEAEPIGEHVVPYLNRLSDALFVLSRWVSRACGEEEILWGR